VPVSFLTEGFPLRSVVPSLVYLSSNSAMAFLLHYKRENITFSEINISKKLLSEITKEKYEDIHNYDLPRN
jgi:hypothetical protein